MALPNIILILTDEEVIHPLNSQVKSWLSKLPGWNLFKTKGIMFNKHYTASSACSPSRASLYSGKYPHPWKTDSHYHNVTSVNGIASDTFHPFEGKHLGNYLRELGYRQVHYIGKWHLTPEPTLEQLKEFGWESWSGPEPHGVSLEHLGTVVDPGYLSQFISLMQKLRQSKEPYFVALNFVNPHDSNLYLLLKARGEIPDFNDMTDLSSKDDVNYKLHPVQRQWLEWTRKYVFCPEEDYDELMEIGVRPQFEGYRQFYFYCLQQVDKLVTEALQHVGPKDILIRTTDHGTAMGTDNGYFGKWFTPSEYVIRVPLGIYIPTAISGWNYNTLSSSIDLVPTILGLIKRFSGRKINVDLPGIDLFGGIRKNIKFITYDNPTKGENQNRMAEKMFGEVKMYESIPFYKLEVVIDNKGRKQVKFQSEMNDKNDKNYKFKSKL